MWSLGYKTAENHVIDYIYATSILLSKFELTLEALTSELQLTLVVTSEVGQKISFVWSYDAN